MTYLIILSVFWLILALIIGNYAASIFTGKRPYGLNGDLIISLVVTLGVGLMGWYVIENFMPNFTGVIRLLTHLLEPPISALIILWVVRYFKK
jgi:uncharacterized membrane protein YeaQ/YmgE (transglycosylase-associated protein family)